MRTRVAAAVAVAGLVMAPLAVGATYDSFPLSTYPMFARARERVVAISTVVAVDGDRTRRLTPHIIGGTDEPMLAAEAVGIAIRSGEAAELCAEIAARSAKSGVTGTLEVVTERYDSLEWFEGDHEPIDRTVHASCEAAG